MFDVRIVDGDLQLCWNHDNGRRSLTRQHRPDRSRPLGRGVPHEWFALLREEEPVFWQDERGGRGFWSLTRYDDVLAASKDYDLLSELGGTSLMDLTPEQVQSRMSMLDSDPPRHTRLRNIVNKAFTPRAVNAYEDGSARSSRRCSTPSSSRASSTSSTRSRSSCP